MPSFSRLFSAQFRLLVAAALSAVACSDNPDMALPTAYGTYRLESLRGVPVTLKNALQNDGIVEGRLILRANNTFEFAVRGSNFAAFKGSYSPLDGSFVVSTDSSDFYPKTTLGTGRLIGDSIRLRIVGPTFSAPGVPPDTNTWVLQKIATDVVPITEGVYVLKALNDKPAPFVTYDSISFGKHVVSQIDFDTLIFRDGLFYRETRSLSSRLDGGEASQGGFGISGLYGGTGNANDRAIYLRPGTQPFVTLPDQSVERDTLYVSGSTLVRKLVMPWGVFQERYERVK